MITASFASLLCTRIVSNKSTSNNNMSLAASSSLASLTSNASSASASSLSGVAAGGGAAAPVFSTWVSAFGNNSHLVGPAWIISSAILTTYSTTRFLKYQGDESMAVTVSSSNKSSIFRMGSSNKENMQLQQNGDPSQRILHGKKSKSIPMSKLSRASLLTLYRFSGSLLLGLFMHAQFYQLSMLPPRFIQTLEAAKLFLLPSLFLFIANYCNSIALDRIGISLTYTSKCGIPLITVLFTLLLDGVSALPSKATLLSLLPIAIGIGAASWNSPTFEVFGFVAAMISTTSQAALNVVSKRVMRKTGIKGAEAQRAMVFVALGIGLAMASANSIGERFREWREYGASSIRGSAEEEGGDDASVLVQPSSPSHPPFWLTALAVFAYHMEYVLSFCFVGLVEPITYGTCDALRRLLIIIAGRQIFGGDKFSKTNMGGIGLALCGALMYSITSARGGTLAPPSMGKK